MLKTNIISLAVNEDKQIFIAPVHDLGGSLSKYQKSTPLDFEAIRNQAWKDNLSGDQQ